VPLKREAIPSQSGGAAAANAMPLVRQVLCALDFGPRAPRRPRPGCGWWALGDVLDCVLQSADLVDQAEIQGLLAGEHAL